jgi:hypothetical protein
MAFDLGDAIGGTGEETRRSVIANALRLSKARAVRHPVADIALQQRVPRVTFHFAFTVSRTIDTTEIIMRIGKDFAPESCMGMYYCICSLQWVPIQFLSECTFS